MRMRMKYTERSGNKMKSLKPVYNLFRFLDPHRSTQRLPPFPNGPPPSEHRRIAFGRQRHGAERCQTWDATQRHMAALCRYKKEKIKKQKAVGNTFLVSLHLLLETILGAVRKPGQGRLRAFITPYLQGSIMEVVCSREIQFQPPI